MGEAYKDNADAEVADQVNKLIQRRQRRAALIDKPLDIVGKQLYGDEFDWKSYQGKVILVDFWATWCGPCLAELPNIKRNYERYHDQGFEVVGINLDHDRKSVDTFFATQSLPWTTVIGADGLAETCGVESIPFVMLVGRDGRVIDLHVRGEILGQR